MDNMYPSFLRKYIEDGLRVVEITASESNDPIEQMIGYFHQYLGPVTDDTDRILRHLSETRIRAGQDIDLVIGKYMESMSALKRSNKY